MENVRSELLARAEPGETVYPVPPRSRTSSCVASRAEGPPSVDGGPSTHSILYSFDPTHIQRNAHSMRPD